MARAERSGIFFEITGVDDQAAAEMGLDAALSFLRDAKVDALDTLRAQEEVFAKDEEIDRHEMGEDFEPAPEPTEERVAQAGVAQLAWRVALAAAGTDRGTLAPVPA